MSKVIIGPADFCIWCDVKKMTQKHWPYCSQECKRKDGK